METEDRRELIALAVLETAVRGREIGGGPITYRRALTAIVPGHRLTVAVTRTCGRFPQLQRSCGDPASSSFQWRSRSCRQ